MRTTKRYTSAQLRQLLDIIDRLDKDEQGAPLDAILEAHKVHPGSAQDVRDMLKMLDASGDVMRLGMGNRYRSLAPEVKR